MPSDGGARTLGIPAPNDWILEAGRLEEPGTMMVSCPTACLRDRTVVEGG